MNIRNAVLSKANQQLYATISCAIFVFLVNVVISMRGVVPDLILIPLSCIPLFCTALILPLIYSLLIITLANIPILFSLILSSDGADILVYYLVSSLAALFVNLFNDKQTKVTGANLCILFWTIASVPLYIATNEITYGNTLTIFVFSNILACFLAETLLLSQSVRSYFGQNGKCTSFNYVLTHAITPPLLFLGILSVQQKPVMTSAIILGLIIICGYGIAHFLEYLLEHDSFTFTNQILNNQQVYSHAGSYFGGRDATSTTSEFPLSHLLNPSQAEQNKKHSKYGLIAVDRTETILFVNKLFREMFNLRTSTPLGRQLSEVGLDPHVLEELRHLINVTINKGPRKIEVKLNRLPEKLRFIEISSQFSNDLSAVSLNDNSSGVILKAKDISKNRTLEDHLVKTQRLNSIANIVRCISHGLNNTLAVIMGQAGCGEDTNNIAEKNDAFNAIIKACDDASDLLRKLLSFIDDKESSFTPVEINQLLTEHHGLFKRIAGDSINVSLELPKEKLASFCDTKLIIQAITNLIINSKEAYSDKKGDISITLRKEVLDVEIADLIPGGKAGTFCCIQIKDNAVGMSTETLQHCCDALFTTKNDEEHSGLGLTMTYGIMRSLDGFLAIESHLNKGCSISLYFPMSDIVTNQALLDDNEESEPKQNKDTFEKETILVIEDNNDFRMVVTKMLERLGLKVHAVASSNEAIEIYDPKKFTIILSDLMMAQMDGSTLLKTLKEKNDKLKAIIMSAYEIPSDPSIKNINTIQKPFDMDTLEEAISNVLEEKEK